MEYKLEELFDLQMGKTPSRNNPEYWNTEDNKWISIADLSKCGKYIETTKEHISNNAVTESGISQIPENTVIMSFKLSIGKTAITSEPMYSNEAIMSFRDRHVIDLLPDYLYYLFSGKDWDVGTNKAVMGNTLNKATLSKVKIRVHDIQKQKEIVDVLDKVRGIITARQQQLQKLDELVKARFVEMFGDAENGESKYPIETLGNLSTKISDGVHAKPEYTEIGRPFLSVVNINQKKIDFTDCKFVSEEAYQKMIKSTKPEKGDVLYTKVGATYGIPAYVDTDVEFCLYVSVCLIKPMHEKINSRFLAIQMDTPFVKHQADKRIKGIGVPDLHLNQIRELQIICPPREMQDEFVHFVEQTDKSKFVEIIELLNLLIYTITKEVSPW